MSEPYYFWKNKHLTQWFVTSPVQFTDDDSISYSSCEQYMMYKKAMLFGDDNTANTILSCNDPKKIQTLGRRIFNFNQTIWNLNKYQIVFKGNLLKFSQNEESYKHLLKIRRSGFYFVEASPYDKVWGIGITEAEAEADTPWNGQNLLGLILTNVSDYLIISTLRDFRE